MKKTILKIIALIFVFTLFEGCAREEFMDVYGFTERFTYSDISPEDFYTDKNKDGNNTYYTFFEEKNPRVMLKLICTKENIIDEMRIYLPKYDENADMKAVSTEEISLFVKVVSSATVAFTGYDINTTEEIIKQMQLYEKKSYVNEGELTKTKENFHFIYHSASLGSEFIIYNTYMKDVPKTEKPESRPMYGDTTKIRTETVPTK